MKSITLRKGGSHCHWKTWGLLWKKELYFQMEHFLSLQPAHLHFQICQHYNLCIQLHLRFISLMNSNMWIKLIGDSKSSQLSTENIVIFVTVKISQIRPNILTMKTWSLHN